MNVVVDTILARRSARAGWLKTPVARDHLETIVACGLSAPSSKNARPWRLHVVQSAALRTELADAAATAADIDDYVPHDPRTGHPYPEWTSTVIESADVLRTAPAAIAIENRGVFSGGRATLSSVDHEALTASLTAYSLESMGIGAAVTSMWLAANSLGIGAAFLGDLAIVDERAKQLLGFDGDLMGVMALGYPAGPAWPRREPPAHTQVAEPVLWH